jgi:hypothetical protein
MLTCISSATLHGVDGKFISVELRASNGFPAFTVVGLPDTAVRESSDRVSAALLSSGLPWPLRRVTVNLAPSRFQTGKYVGITTSSRVNSKTFARFRRDQDCDRNTEAGGSSPLTSTALWKTKRWCWSKRFALDRSPLYHERDDRVRRPFLSEAMPTKAHMSVTA